MPDDNRYVVMQILDEVRDGLGPYVLRKYRDAYAELYFDRLFDILDVAEVKREELLNNEAEILREFDAYRWLRAMTKNKDVFLGELGVDIGVGYRDFNHKNAFNFVYELLSARNELAHSNVKQQFDDDGIMRIAENATRLLSAVGATQHAKVSEIILRRVGKRVYGKEDLEISKELIAGKQQLDKTIQELKSTKQQLASTSKELETARDELTNANLDLIAISLKLSSTETKLKSAENELASTRKQLAEMVTASDLSNNEKIVRNREERPAARSRARTAARRGAVKSKWKSREADAPPRNADLRGKDLSGKNLAHSMLAHANLSGARLRQANLSQADLAYANLSEADMTGVNLQGADLTGANLYFATLINADLTGATLRQARLQGALDTTTKLPDGKLWTTRTNMGRFLK